MTTKLNKKKNTISIFITELIRIKNVIKWFISPFVGFVLGLSSLDLKNYLFPLFVFIITTFCILSFTFAINNYYDAESDQKNPRKRNYNAIASGNISKSTGAYVNIILVVIPLIVSFLFKFEVFFLCLFILTVMWMYSAPPLRIKGRPGIDVIWHFIGFVSLVIWGSFIAGSIDMMTWLVAISLGTFSCIGQIWNHIQDYSYDKESGTVTFAVWAGLEMAKTTYKITVALHIFILIPLIILFSLRYYSTIILLTAGSIIGFFIVKPKKYSFPAIAYYLQVGFGGSVYLSCLLYKINFLLGKTPWGW